MLLLNERRGVLQAQQNWRFIMYQQKFEMKKERKHTRMSLQVLIRLEQVTTGPSDHMQLSISPLIAH